MDKTNENTKPQKPKISKMAIASPLVVVLGFLTLIALITLLFLLEDSLLNITLLGHLLVHSLNYLAIVALLGSALAGVIFGIIADRMIQQSKGLLRGRAFSISGTALGLLPILVFLIARLLP